MLYTGKGDNGTTKVIFGCDQKISKNSAIAEALGSLDEINSFLGLCKVQSDYLNFKLDDLGFSEVIHEMQNCLFSIQAELAGAEKSIGEIKISELESYINQIEKELPPIKSFLISGGVPNLPIFKPPFQRFVCSFSPFKSSGRYQRRSTGL